MPEVLADRLGTRRAFPPGEELMLALGIAAADLGALVTKILEVHGLSHVQYNILRILRGAGESGVSHTSIMQRIAIGAPDVTRLIDRLEERGLVRRARDSEDRRRVLHRIEPRGADLLDRVGPELSILHDRIEAAMPASRMRRLVALCEEVIDLAASPLLQGASP